MSEKLKQKIVRKQERVIVVDDKTYDKMIKRQETEKRKGKTKTSR